ncbi:MAG: TIGR01212 family radical SAM protein [Clostridia bacterium]|nr:TIGR01212 family radical SAM protein [Clostridia bacterium]
MYRTLSAYLKQKYGKKIKKICIDGGFSCPNRDGRCGVGGCIYCGERGAGEHIDPTASIAEQVRRGLESGRAEGYIAYFQSFTNTYASPEVLAERYSAALFDERILVLAIGTRPDCIDRDVCEILKKFQTKVDIWVELGLQTANDRTAKLINRGYTLDVYLEAARLLTEYEIPFVSHMIIGLPEEGEEDALRTAEVILDSGAFGIKIHSLYVMEGTRMADLYRQKLYTPPTLDEYVDRAAKVLALVGDRLVVHRITGDCPEGLLVAPEWNRDKSKVIDLIRQRLVTLSKS